MYSNLIAMSRLGEAYSRTQNILKWGYFSSKIFFFWHQKILDKFIHWFCVYSTVCHNYCWISTSHVMAYWECGNILVSSMWSYLVWQAITFVLRKRSIIQPEIFWLCFMSRGKISKYVKWYLVLNGTSFTTANIYIYFQMKT